MNVAPSRESFAEPEGLTLRDYLAVVWRRKWVILLVVVVATTSAYWFAARQPNVYQASTTLMYESQLDLSNPLTSGGQSGIGGDERYAQLLAVGTALTSPDVRRSAEETLTALGVSSAGLSLSSEPIEDSGTSSHGNLVRITATGNDPDRAASVANAYAAAFVAFRKKIMVSQIGQGMAAVAAEMATYEGASRRSMDYLILKQRLRDLQLLLKTVTGNFMILVPASPPAQPVSPKPLRSAILGFGVGLFAGLGLAFLLEQLNMRLKSPEEIATKLHLPLLGQVPRVPRRHLAKSRLIALARPDGQTAEAFRLVRTSLDFMALGGGLRSIVITSCVQGEGKSLTLANLAVTMAMAGRRVIVVDAELRRSRQHLYFGVPNERGVSTVVLGRDTLQEALVPVELPGAEGGSIGRSLLYVLPGGPKPPNPNEVVGSERMHALVQELTQQADIVLLDAPALLPVSDAMAIAALVDGLLFFADLDVVKKQQLSTVAARLAAMPVRKMGLIVRVGKGSGHYYGSEYKHAGASEGQGHRQGHGHSPAEVTTATSVKDQTLTPAAGC